MYKKANKIISDIGNLTNYIDGNDIYNSQVVQEIQNPELPREDYEITVYQYRPDLIAKEFYGSAEYSGFVLLQSGMVLSNLTKGTILRLIKRSDLDKLLRTF